MKPLIVVLLLVFGLCDASAQGVVGFWNNASTLVTIGATGEPVPVGSEFLAGLYYGDDGISDESRYVQIGPPASFYLFPGWFTGGERTVPTPIGGWAMFQVRAWEAVFGSTYEEALAAPPREGRGALVGKSNIMRIRTDPPFGHPPPPGLTSWGLQGFSLTPVPEPSTLILIAGALMVLLGTRRRLW